MNKVLKEAAANFFKNYETKEVCFGTPDGNVWFEKDESLAKNHARETKQECYKITREEMETPQAGKTTGKEDKTPPAPKVGKTAKALLDEHGIDPAQVKGTGPGGLVTQPDAQKAVDAKLEAAKAKEAEDNKESGETSAEGETQTKE